MIAGLKNDDDLTRLQQKQTQDLFKINSEARSRGIVCEQELGTQDLFHTLTQCHARGMRQTELQMPKFSAT